jgi:MerR family transcriptional regulator, redox-sensitive transcriptional activator SoxR
VSGQRRYDPDVLQRLSVIRTGQQAGFTLDELRILFEDSPAVRWHSLIQRKWQDLNALLDNVLRMKALAECIYLTGEKHKGGYRTKDGGGFQSED